MIARIDRTPDPVYTMLELQAYAAIEHEERLKDRAGYFEGEEGPDFKLGEGDPKAKQALQELWAKRQERGL